MPSTKPECITCAIHTQHQQAQPGIKAVPQRKFDISTELQIICQYHCHEQSSLQLGVKYQVSQGTIQNILHRYHKPPRSYRQAQQTRRGTPTLTFPLSTEIPQLLQDPKTKPYLRHLIAILLLTEGSAGHRKTGQPYITFTNKAIRLHQIFADLIHYTYNQPPSSYFKPYWSKAGHKGSKAYYTTYFRLQDTEAILKDLYKLTPSFRTRPKRGHTWEKYLEEPTQPTLKFLFDPNIPDNVQLFAVVLAMSTEGTISPMFRKDAQYPYPHLVFGCKHPILQKQWQKFLKQQGIPLKISNAILESGKLETAQRFLDLGGFLKGIRMRQNSYYAGIDRHSILKAILIDRESYPIDSSLPLKQKHALLRKKALAISEEK